MTNTNLTASIIVKDGLAEFKNGTPFIQGINRQYDKRYAAYGAQEGETIQIEKPKQYTMRSGKVASVQNNTEVAVSLTRSRQRGVDLKFSSAELALDIGVFGPKYIKPAMETLTSGVESEIMIDAYQQTGQYVGTPGTDPATQLVIGQAKAKLTKSACPMSMRSGVISSDASAALVNGLGTNRFQDTSQLRNMFITGNMGVFNGFEFAESNQVPRHTVGTSDGNYAVTSAPSEGATSIVVKTGAGTWTKGDIIEVAGVNKVNPRTKVSTGDPMQFVVTADYAGGAGTVSVSPAMYSTGPLQNVDALPQADAAITEPGTASTAYDQNLFYHKDAFAFGSIDLPLYGNNNFESRQVMDNVSMRFAKVIDGINDDILYRFDLLYGFITVIPEWVVRLWGK